MRINVRRPWPFMDMSTASVTPAHSGASSDDAKRKTNGGNGTPLRAPEVRKAGSPSQHTSPGVRCNQE